jgi:hypothetical protein
LAKTQSGIIFIARYKEKGKLFDNAVAATNTIKVSAGTQYIRFPIV